MAESSSVRRGADWAVAVALTIAQGLASLVVGSLSLLFAMISDGCGSSGDDPLICAPEGTLVFFGGILLEWLLLAAGVVTSVVLLVRAGRTGRRAWTAPLVGTGVGLLGVAALVVMLVLVSS